MRIVVLVSLLVVAVIHLFKVDLAALALLVIAAIAHVVALRSP